MVGRDGGGLVVGRDGGGLVVGRDGGGLVVGRDGGAGFCVVDVAVCCGISLQCAVPLIPFIGCCSPRAIAVIMFDTVMSCC